MAGCAGSFSLAGLGGTPLPALALRGGAVMAAGPDGYCVAPAASNAYNGFALLVSCDAIAGRMGRPNINALITMQVGDAASASVVGSEPMFQAFLASDAGRVLLSRSGKAETVKIGAIDSRQGQITAVFDDLSPVPVRGFQQREWRGFVDVGDRLVTLTVRGLARDPLSDQRGRTLLDQAVAALRAVNAASQQ